MNDPTLLKPGQRFARYEITRVLGRGGMGAVYEARHIDLRKAVALKTMLGPFVNDQAAVERFNREGRAASRVRHPHVADVMDFGVAEGVPFLVMELLEGESLGDLLDRKGAIPVAALANVMVPVVAAIAAAHEAGVIHRDLKPDNIYLARERKGALVPKVLDFGISKLTYEANQRLTQTGSVLGTPHYMPPEQARGDGQVSPHWDQYGLGVLLYQCATGVLPFDDPNVLALLQKIIAAECKPPRALRPEIPEAFETVILRAMHRDPDARYPTVAALGRALLPFVDSTTRAVFERELGAGARRASEPPLALLRDESPTLSLPAVSADESPAPRAAEAHPNTILSVELPQRTRPEPKGRWRVAMGVVALVGGIAAGIMIAQRSIHRTRPAVATAGPTASAPPPSSRIAAPLPATTPPAPATATPNARVGTAAIAEPTQPQLQPHDAAEPPVASTVRRRPARTRARSHGRTNYAPHDIY